MNLQTLDLTFFVTCEVTLSSEPGSIRHLRKLISGFQSSICLNDTKCQKWPKVTKSHVCAILQGRTCLSMCLQKAAHYATSNFLQCWSIFIPPCPKSCALALVPVHTGVRAEKGQILCWLLKILTIFLLGGWSQYSHVPALCLQGWLLLTVRGAWKRFGSIHSEPLTCLIFQFNYWELFTRVLVGRVF